MSGFKALLMAFGLWLRDWASGFLVQGFRCTGIVDFGFGISGSHYH